LLNFNFNKFDCSDLTDFEIDLIEFNASSTWCEHFVELRKRSEAKKREGLARSALETNVKVGNKETEA
jgi:hypothetical protein